MKLVEEFKHRLPFYADDWRTGLHLKTVSAVFLIFFTSVGPAMTFGVVLHEQTGGQLGVVEVLLATGIFGVVYAVFSGQPLVIVGVTGPIAIFLSTVYTLAVQFQIPFIPWLAWINFWTAIMHIAIAIFGLCAFVRFVTEFSCDVFGFLIGVIYVVDACEHLALIFRTRDQATGFISLLLALSTFFVSLFLHGARGWTLFNARARDLIADFGPPATIILFTGISCIPYLSNLPIERLQVPAGFATTSGRAWLPDFAALPTWAIFAALLPAIVLTALIYFDHNVSSLLSQRPEFNLKKGAAFNLDFLVVGVTMFAAFALGIPVAHGLIPQAPLHVRALADIKLSGTDTRHPKEYFASVRETRLSGLLQAAAIGAMVFAQPVLALVPAVVLDGLFLYMGVASFFGNGLASRLVAVITDRHTLPPSAVPEKQRNIFTLIQLLCWGAIYGLTRSPGAIAFPLCICVLVPLRRFVLPKFFAQETLQALDSESFLPVSEAARQSLELPADHHLAYVPRVTGDAVPAYAFGSEVDVESGAKEAAALGVTMSHSAGAQHTETFPQRTSCEMEVGGLSSVERELLPHHHQQQRHRSHSRLRSSDEGPADLRELTAAEAQTVRVDGATTAGVATDVTVAAEHHDSTRL